MALAALCGTVASPAVAADADPAKSDGPDLSNLSIEQLANIQVRSASKTEEPLSAAPTALYVITSDQILSSGATSVPEVLRLAPNLQVQQVDANQHSISARGFNGLQAGNKLLALVDGRSIYTPLGATVFWNLHWPLLEDVKQIEVISGPGGTLYGPNAVNGVINITTKDAQETIGTLARVTAGPFERTAAIRQGFALGGSGAMRAYFVWHDNEGLPSPTAIDINDSFRGWQAGLRSDFASDDNHVTVQGDVFRDHADSGPNDSARGYNLLGRWSRTLSPSASFQLQAYYDYFERHFTMVDDSLETVDAEAQLNASAARHSIVAGFGVRTTRDEFVNQLNIFQLVPPRRRLWVFNGFVQDHYELARDLSVIAGVKLERSTFSGWQVLPNLRVAWRPSTHSLWWASVSRAVRTPSRIDRQLEARPVLVPAPLFRSEKLVAIEAGYRGQPTTATSISVNAFLNLYDDLRTTELVGGSFQLQNGATGKTYGVEAWGSAQLTPSWRASLGLSTLWKDLHDKVGHANLIPRNSFGADPHWQVVGRSDLALTDRLQLTLDARAVGPIRQAPAIPGYVEAGGELSFKASPQIELFVAGRNLLHRTHLESDDPQAAQLVRRSVYGGARARF
jgi:iron complex outermembrane receptor protein